MISIKIGYSNRRIFDFRGKVADSSGQRVNHVKATLQKEQL